jgi:hypothetical protein
VLNPHSLEVVTAKVEPSLAQATLDERYQFERSPISRSIQSMPGPRVSSSIAPSRSRTPGRKRRASAKLRQRSSCSVPPAAGEPNGGTARTAARAPRLLCGNPLCVC